MIKIQNSTLRLQFKHTKQCATKLDTLKTHQNENSLGKNWTADESCASEKDELIDAATGTRVQETPVAGKRVWHMFIITAFRHRETLPGADYALSLLCSRLCHIRVKDFEQFGAGSACSCHAYARRHTDARFHSGVFPSDL